MHPSIDEIQPVSYGEINRALKIMELKVPYAVIYTLRLLAMQFFRTDEGSGEQADLELADLYANNSEVIDAQLENYEGDTSVIDFPVEGVFVKDNDLTVIKPKRFHRPSAPLETSYEPQHVPCS